MASTADALWRPAVGFQIEKNFALSKVAATTPRLVGAVYPTPEGFESRFVQGGDSNAKKLIGNRWTEVAFVAV